MNKKPIIRIVSCLIIILIARIVLIDVLDKINVLTTNYINVIDNEISIDDNFESIYAINNLKYNNGVLDFNIKPDNNEYTLFIRLLTFHHEIYLNNKLYSQNIDQDKKQYNQNFAYKTIEIKDISNIRIYGDSLEKLEFFIAKRDIMDSAVEKRTIYYTIKLMSLFLLVMLFIIMFLNDKKEKCFIVFVLVGMTSIIKSIALGELPVLARLLDVNITNYCIYGNITTVVNTLLPIIIMLNLFEIKLTKKIYKYISVILLFTVIILSIDFSKYYYKVFIAFSFVNISITIYGATYKKSYYKVIVLNGIIYFSLAVYQLNVMNGNLRTGVLHFYTSTGYIGAIIYLIGFAIVFIKKYKSRIKESIEIKKELERITLLRGISHDLKLPLSVIKISSQMIESQKLNCKQIKEFANDITQEVNILEKMTDNINAYLKLGYKDGKDYHTSVKAVFKRIEKDFNLINYNNKYDFSVLYDNKDYYVNIDELELYRLLYNLLDNSFKYCNDYDRILISYKVEDRLVITVEDTGIGMDSEQANKIFSPFYRLDKSRTKEGLGLGLSVVKGIVDECGGDISIKSEIGKGTKVIILLQFTTKTI
ncbi:HAMP domain-containing sensor histidine kinase [Abyssisolibacter fermentans]|uniref:HAMP domain-containing sensor histidine kinase n=1 Tax=Abyssisolibacter fermentans TaxID=1766203 RepID=UPI00082A1746|nr:HAMP domain-containing sensor histidine kinase [Abyssisolibacter fermentans]